MRTRSRRALAIAPAVAALAQILSAAASAQEPCRLTPIGTVRVAAVRDGRTLSLADGRELRLAAIEAPDASRAGLQSIVSGQALRLEALGADHDRYGRLVAFAFAGQDQQSVQQAMLEAGLARVAARAGGRPCAETLLSAERKARAATLGLWADPNFAPLPAESPNLLARRGQFALVEGKVLSVHPSGGTIYVNFGRRWTRDFTVTIRRRLQRSFTAAGVEPSKLQGRRIRVRGFIEQHGGPIIDAEGPEQIEFVDRQMTGG
jgi:endonuclease YncB( thermonuclease family)